MSYRFRCPVLLPRLAAFACIVAATEALCADGTRRDGRTAATPGKPIAFNISSQPLSDALMAYGETTLYTALVDVSSTMGRRSGAATGVFTPEQALNAVLAGTGLLARFSSSTAFTLTPVPSSSRNSPVDQTSAKYAAYFLAIQTTVRLALCSQELTRPGAYRAALQIWIDDAGVLQRSELLSSTNSAERDVSIKSALMNARVSGLPPDELPQPVTLVLTPRSGDDTECGGSRAESR